MSQVRHVEVTESLLAGLQLRAAAQGSNPEAIVTRAIEKYLATPEPPGHLQGDPFRQMFGAADLGRPIGIDNEQIDADLVTEYARGL